MYPDSTHTLLSYRDIRENEIHVETYEENKEEFLLFTKDIGQAKETLEMVPSLPSGLYYTYIKPVPYVAYKVIFRMLTHSKLGMTALAIPESG